MALTKEYIIWLAGFFDGEGSVSIGVNWYKILKPPFRQKRYHLRVGITQNVKEVLEEVQSNFGGCLKLIKSKYTNIQRPIYQIAIDCLKGQHFLETIYPYLKVKRAQAKAALDFQKYTTSEVTSEQRRQKGAEFKELVEGINNSIFWAA